MDWRCKCPRITDWTYLAEIEISSLTRLDQERYYTVLRANLKVFIVWIVKNPLQAGLSKQKIIGHVEMNVEFR